MDKGFTCTGTNYLYAIVEKNMTKFNNWYFSHELFKSKIQLICTSKICEQIEQEAHGPHRSPEKTVQINKHMIIS